jgi:hypothetical protein
MTWLQQTAELELGLLDREKRSAGRRLNAARFPTIKLLDTFDFAARPSVDKMLIARRARDRRIALQGAQLCLHLAPTGVWRDFRPGDPLQAPDLGELWISPDF